MLTRREFFRVFLIGGIIHLFKKKVYPDGIAYGASGPLSQIGNLNLLSSLHNKGYSDGVKAEEKPKVAMFWRRVD